jgi:hypothetical protein
MFGFVGPTATIKNLGLLDCFIMGGNHVGTLAGYSVGRIENCYVADTLGAPYWLNRVQGESDVGGLVGYNSGTIQNCYTTCVVYGSGIRVGGIAGVHEGLSASITICYSTSYISTSTGVVGGIAGGMASSNSGSVRYCVALNPGITSYGEGTYYFYRIMGRPGALEGNYARSDMKMDLYYDPTSYVCKPSSSGADGADVDLNGPNGGYRNQDFWEKTMYWDFTNTWELYGTPPLPRLKAPPQQ